MIEFIGCVIWVYGIDYAEKSAVMNYLRELKILLKRDQEGCDLNDSRISVYLFLRLSSWEHFKWKELGLPNWEPDKEPLQLEKGNFIAPDYANVWPFPNYSVWKFSNWNCPDAPNHSNAKNLFRVWHWNRPKQVPDFEKSENTFEESLFFSFLNVVKFENRSLSAGKSNKTIALICDH